VSRSGFKSKGRGRPSSRELRVARPDAAATAPLFLQALALHQAGRLAEAEAIYRGILALDPDHFDARHHLGIIHQQRGEHIAALRQIDAALQVDPDEAAALNNRGVVLAALDRFAEAADSYGRAIARKPDYVDALANRGVALFKLGRFAEAVESCDRAIALRPANAAALANRGNALYAIERYAEALTSYDRAIALRPDDGDTHCNRGNTLAALEQFDAALASCDRALALAPNHVEALNSRGNVLSRLQRFDEAIASYDRAIALKPDYADAFSNRGNALRDTRRIDAALADYDRAIALRPAHAEYHNNRAIALAGLKRYDDALTSYARAIALKPDYAEAYSNRGWALRDLRRPDEALASFARAFALAPDHDCLRGTYLYAKRHVCDWSDFDAECAAMLAAVDGGKAAARPFELLPTPASPAQQLRSAQFHVADKFGAACAPLWRGERYAHRRIRVAYLSADLRDHPIAMLTTGMFARHDRARFETVAISFKSDTHNQVRERLSAHFDRFIDVQSMSDSDIARLVRELEIDIAVDLNGYTEGCRPHVFAQRPAPVQVNYLGFAATLGPPHWDYIVADRFVVPERDRAHYAEQVVYLPDCFMANDDGRKISPRTPSRAEAGLPENGFVFCCFNNSFKISPHVFDVWMRLLAGVEGSVLWLSATHASAMEHLAWEAEQRGIAARRLIFAARVPLNEDHLARVRLADLFVDTLYYNAHTTAADALWAGVPVLTCAGSTFASRVAGSLLGAVGLPELIAGSLAEYEALALALARDPARLTALRAKLAHNRDVFPLFDTARFTRHIEAAYTTMWERVQRGEPPQSFAVPVEDRAAP
jgi:predicted O-linked N-acetylglucosamine transferase (SPINDLY family)